ncbi:MAG: DUF1622 domain-containing protein [Armatimonadaceae bacterium]
MEHIFEPLVVIISAVGIGILTVGVGLALVSLIRTELRKESDKSGKGMSEAMERLRHRLGYYLLLGLEVLIAADVIETVIRRTWNDVLVLGAIVLIRTLISFSLNWEIEKSSYSERSQNNAN